MDKPRKITVEGYEMIEKTVGKSGTSGYVYLPAKWVGKKVVIVPIEPPNKPPNK